METSSYYYSTHFRFPFGSLERFFDTLALVCISSYPTFEDIVPGACKASTADSQSVGSESLQAQWLGRLSLRFSLVLNPGRLRGAPKPTSV
jgi:hypothetical protein